LNVKIGINQFIVSIAVVIVAIVTLALFLQYNFAKEKIEQSYLEKYYSQSRNAKEDIKFIRDSVEYKFMLNKTSNIQALNKVYDIYEKSDGNLDVEKSVKILNKDLEYGTYEIALINKQYIVEKTSYAFEFGFDLGEFSNIKSLLRDVFNDRDKMDISVPIYEASSGKLKKYLTRRSYDGKYIIQVAYVLDFVYILNEKKRVNNATQEIYLTDANAMVDTTLFSKNKKVSLEDSQKQTKALLQKLKKYTNIDQNKIDALSLKYADTYTPEFAQDILNIFVNDDMPTMYIDEKSIKFFY
jgi:hypothetical protein